MITDILVEEHTQIRFALQILDKIKTQILRENGVVSMEDLDAVLGFLSFYLGQVHHGKEEELLFPLLGAAGCAQSGPRCTLFLGYHMDWNPINPIFDYVKKRGYVIPKKAHSTVLQSAFDQNRFLGIPLEEHEAGFLAVEVIKNETALAKNGERALGVDFAQFLSAYLNLMDLHIRKEEECLFKIVGTKVSPEEFADLTHSAVRYDESFEPHRIERSLETLLCLKEKYLGKPND